ncbi:MAG: hypothetical protein WBA97_06570 [Actinophytocola sp.]|uniref:hypothetical protein n=1 Tax=Actinophytocola sp. TaxID=1872138 RepID=UPI003C75084C
MNAQLWKSLGDFVRILLPPAPLTVRVTVPDVGEDALETARTALHQAFSLVVEELGIERDVVVTMTGRHDGADIVEVAADGRPVAIFPAPPVAGWAAQVGARTHSALLRRARVLLDDATVDKIGKKLSGPAADPARAALRRTLEYLLDNGIGVQHLDGETAWDDQGCGYSPIEVAECLINDLASPELAVTVAESALRDTPDDQRTHLVDLRLALYDEHGIRLPEVAIASHDIGPSEVRVRLNDLTTPALPLTAPATLPGVLAALGPVLTDHAAWFLRADEVAAQRTELASVVPDLVHLSETQVPTWLLSACLRALSANSDSIRNLPRIIWLLLDSDPPRDGIDEVTLSKSGTSPVPDLTSITHEPEFLASAIRRLIAYEAWAGGETPADTHLFGLPAEWEDALLHATDSRTVAKTEWRIVRALFASPGSSLIVTHTLAGVAPIRGLLRALPHPPRVIASQELPPHAPLPIPVGWGDSSSVSM